MKTSKIATYLLIIFLVTGCKSTKITSRNELVTGQIPRPDQILVYDFASTSAEVPAESVLFGRHADHTRPQTEKEITLGREAGAELAIHLVKEIKELGLPAVHASKKMKPQINDLVIQGYLISFDKGNEIERVTIGFGLGASHLATAVEGFQMTSNGLRKIGEGSLESGGGKNPGVALGTSVLIVKGNPAGLIVSTAVNVYEEASGMAKVKGRADKTANEIAEALEERFIEQGWIEDKK